MSRVVLEIGTEAIPAGYILPALTALETKTRDLLRENRIAAESVRALGTAKRLVVEVRGVAPRQEDRVREVQGPRVDAAFKDGKPTPAAEGFARKNGVSVDALERVRSERGEFLVARIQEAGRPAKDVLAEALPGVVAGLSWPKTMVWNETGFRFPRPVRWIVGLWNGEVLPARLAGLTAGMESRGHWLLGPGEVAVKEADALEGVLEHAGVILDPALRREKIQAGLEAEARRLQGRIVEDQGLLDEVIFLVEHPSVLSGRFDAEFLKLPREVVVTAMRAHQRYFAMESAEGALLPHFLVVCDGRWDDPSQVVAGNERVLRARLSDARFYWDMDRRTGLDALSERLRQVVWLEAVGSLGDKAERVVRLVDWLGERWSGKGWPSERDQVLRAARLAKADLASEMIKDGKEFTGLQGVMGARYAEAGGEPPAIARALIEQYLPRGAGDALPASTGGTLLAFADRLDTIVGCWSAGFIPSGSQDPYGLRRAANGMIRILLEKGIHQSLGEVVRAGAAGLPAPVRKEGLETEVLRFLADRQAFFLRERGISYDTVDAVLAADSDDPLDALARAEALQAIRGEPALERLVIGFKRAANILKGVDERSLPDPASVEWEQGMEAELALWDAIASARKALAGSRERKGYPAMLGHLLELRAPIDRFFDEVLVMAEDAGEKSRRLALLAAARELFHNFFDPARIVIEGEGAGR